jgi:ABC-2 type transport system permease protein
MSKSYAMMSNARVFAAYLGDIRYELTKMARTPAFAVPTIIFPAMFYLLFGVIVGGKDPQAALQGLARWGVFGVMAPGLFGFGVSLAFEREQGLLVLKQALPMPPGSYLIGRMVNAMVFVCISALLLLGIAVFAGHVPVAFGQVARLLLVDVLGVLPFCAIGLFVGSMISGQAAPAIINLIYLPMAFLSGLLVPLQFLPKVLQTLGPLWPAHHLAQLSLAAVGAPSVGTIGNHVAALAGITVLFFVLAMRRLSSSGISLLGKSGAPGIAIPLRRALNMGVIGVSIGLIVAGVMGGTAPHAAASTASAATSKDAEEGTDSAATDAASSAPPGVAAPSTTLVADFDNGSEQVAYGIGMHAFDDKPRGGNSTTSQKLVEDGAEHSKSALEVTGVVGDGIQYPFVGTSFLPNGKPTPDFSKQGFMDYSSRHTLRFFARGDGHSYTVAISGPVMDAIPAMYGFTAGPEWQEVKVPLHELGGLDLARVKAISFGTMAQGPFRFQIDNVRIE